MPRPRRRIPCWGLQNTCFTVFKLLGHQKRRVFPCLGRDGSDGQACHVPGASWPSKSSHHGPKGFPFDVIFSHLFDQKTISWACWFTGLVFYVLLWISGGSDPPSARAGAVETQFRMFDAASKGASFLLAFVWTFLVLAASKSCIKALQNQAWKQEL